MAARSVTLFEVGPRDGLQNESAAPGLRDKSRFVDLLVKAGVRELELGSFVRPDRVPQMADTDALFKMIRAGRLRLGRARAWSLVPNRRGLERALAAGVRNIAIFTAATDSFARHNIGMTVEESLREYREVVSEARARTGGKIGVRGYVSTAFGCPYEGKVAPRQALRVIDKLAGMGCEQISIGDTIGVAAPADVDRVVGPALREHPASRLAVHFHDTRGTALANCLRALELGIRVFDSSAGGLGGCPYAPGAGGNVASEDVVYMMERMGLRTGIDLRKLCEASLWLARKLKRPLTSKYLLAFAAARR